MKRLVSVIMVAALTLGGCAKQAVVAPTDSSSIGENKSVAIRLVSVPNTLDCYAAGTIDCEEISKLLYDLVLNPDPNTGAPQPGVITEWETPDDLTVLMTIGDGYVFQNGEKLLPEDIIYSIEQNRDHSLGGHAFSTIKDISVEGDNKVAIHLETPFVDVVTALTTVYVYDKSYCESAGEDWANKPVGTGPYKLKEYIPGSKVVLEAWEDYPFEKCYMDQYTFLSMEEDSAAYIALESGDIDLTAISIADYERAKENSSVTVYEGETISLYQVWMNVAKPPFDNINIRKAMAYAYNTEGFLTLNKGMIKSDSFVPRQAEFYYSAPNAITYNLDKARELLEAEGYSSTNPLKIELITYAGEKVRQSYEAYQLELKQIGIEMEITTMEFGAYLDKMYKGEFQLISDDWAIPLFLMNYMAMLYSGSQGDYNGTFFTNERCDELYHIAAGSANNPQVGIDAAKELQVIAWDQVPFIPTFTPKVFFVADNDIKGIKLQINGRPELRKLCR